MACYGVEPAECHQCHTPLGVAHGTQAGTRPGKDSSRCSVGTGGALIDSIREVRV